jgi:hypothetical protein
VDRGEDLAGRTLQVTTEHQRANPRRARTHGWVAFEVLRQAPGQRLSAEEYAQRLFNPPPEIVALAATVPGVRNAYQDLKHIRCDIAKGRVAVDKPLDAEWYQMARCGEKKPR